jgi:hypothetical protein
VPVKERHGNATVWKGVVHVVRPPTDLTANRAFAWSSPIEGSDKRFAVVTTLQRLRVTQPIHSLAKGHTNNESA